ncbi:MAG: hypothetical protein AAB263_20165 [Planctomycetota bacterium]
MPKWLWALVGTIPIILVGFFIAISLFIPSCHGKSTFLNKYKKAHDLEQLKLISAETNVVTRQFPNGEWVALIYEHDCCTGKGFVANIFNDSKGAVFTNTDHGYCNTKATELELLDINAVNINEFYAKLGIALSNE